MVRKKIYKIIFYFCFYFFSSANSLAGTINDFFIDIFYIFFLGAYEYVIKKSTGVDTAVSRLFIYYVGRANSNPSTITDSGCSMTDAIEALESLGTCLESYWPYDIANVNTKPDDQAYQEAQGHKITEAFQVNIDLNEMKTCLAQGFPFVFGIQLYKSFDQAGTTGVVPMPDASDQGRDKDGEYEFNFCIKIN